MEVETGDTVYFCREERKPKILCGTVCELVEDYGHSCNVRPIVSDNKLYEIVKCKIYDDPKKLIEYEKAVLDAEILRKEEVASDATELIREADNDIAHLESYKELWDALLPKKKGQL